MDEYLTGLEMPAVVSRRHINPFDVVTRREFLAHSAAVATGLNLISMVNQTRGRDATDAQGSFSVGIHVDVSKPVGPLRQIWRFFGADEPNYATMKHGKKLLGALGAMDPKRVYFRVHNLLTSGDGTPALKWGSTGAYREDAQGNPVYDWTILDRIFDTYMEQGVRPYVEIGFMPKDLSTRPEPYQHTWSKNGRLATGWAYPPKDYKKWGELVYQWTRHCVQRYGRAEVETWYWQTWNEANILYWQGTPEAFHKLHDFAIAGVRRALPTARVGGPDVAGDGGQFQRDFLEHCLRGTNHATRQTGTPLDFVAFHAKGSPEFVEGHVRMGIAHQLRTIDKGFEIIASYPELRFTPVVIGESDPEGCAACQGEQLGYRNGTMYSSYTVASFARKLDLADRHGVNFLGALTWAFEFEDQPYFAGYRALATNGIDKPVLNTFRMFSKMTGQRLTVESDHAVDLDTMMQQGVRDRADVAALVSLDGCRLCIMVWHYHDDDVPGPGAQVRLLVNGLPPSWRSAALCHFRIDQTHSNAYGRWQRMGCPQHPTAQQYAELEQAGQLALLFPPRTIQAERGHVMLDVHLPRQAVSLLVMDWQQT